MAISNTKISLISITVLMALSSCGKSKDLKTPEAPVIPAIQAPPLPSTATQTPPTNSLPATGNLLPGDNSSGFGNEVLPPLPVGPAMNSNEAATNNSSSNNFPSSGTNSISENSNVIRSPLKPAAPQIQQAAQVDFTNQEAVKTGGQTKDLFYTSAGDDGLMNEFKNYVLKVSKDQQRMNANLAKAIVTAKLSRSNSSGEVRVELTIDESLNGAGTVKTYRLKAVSDSSGTKLVVADAVTGSLEFQGGLLKCIDADGGCENAYAKIKMSGAYARLIFRNSFADMHFLVQEKIVNNPGFDLFKKYISNSVLGNSSNERINTLQLSSFEVVNGRAGMGALLTTTDKEMIGLSIPLVVSGTKSEVSAPVAKLSDLSKNYDLSPLANIYSQKLSQQIGDVKLVNNNGLGQLKLKMTIGASANAGSIWMVVSKVKKPEMTIEQIQAFESKVKHF